VDDVAWGALALSLTLLGGIWTWFAYRRRGFAAGLRGAAFTLLPLAAYLTKTLQMLGEVGDAVADWATSLVFSPQVWLGIVIAGIAGVLFVVSGWLAGRRDDTPKQVRGKKTEAVEGSAIVDDDMADIEAILRKRGIS
jgi:hypothetical protein